ncbi:MAG: hypothetical protein GF335_03575 [Candidatus Moranbacteria bacterium]|nr:hypothetical protein [Candidatus Moranbacteria bacterium]
MKTRSNKSSQKANKANNKSFKNEISFNNTIISPFDIVMEAIKDLSNKRMEEVLIKRFGLDNRDSKTLEQIGKDLKITRERVRQIENEALRKIQEKSSTGSVKNKIDFILQKINKIIKKYQGIASEIRILNEYNNNNKLKEEEEKALAFSLKLGRDFHFLNKPRIFERTWHFKDADINIVFELNNSLRDILKKNKKPLSDQEIIQMLNYNEKLKNIPDNILYSYIDIPKMVQKNIFGKWGLDIWPSIKPKKIKDKIYLIFQKFGKPMHYIEIAKEIEKLSLDNKKICTPTVHNELIKDPRFILTGRGIYALKEWDFYTGTVKDVLINILKKVGEPLKKETLVEKTLEQRQVKVSTITLNLQDKKVFEKKGNKYYLKKQK